MGEYFSDVDLLPVIVERPDDPKIVSANIKYNKGRHIVCASKRSFHVIETGKGRCLDQSVPSLKRNPGRGVFEPERRKCVFGDDLHDRHFIAICYKAKKPHYENCGYSREAMKTTSESGWTYQKFTTSWPGGT